MSIAQESHSINEGSTGLAMTEPTPTANVADESDTAESDEPTETADQRNPALSKLTGAADISAPEGTEDWLIYAGVALIGLVAVMGGI